MHTMTAKSSVPPRTSPNADSTVYLVTGDIGGTNSRMSLYTVEPDHDMAHNVGVTKSIITKTFRNSEQFTASALEQENAFVENVMKPFLSFCWDEQQQREYVQEKNAIHQEEDHFQEEKKDFEMDDIETVKLSPVNENTIIVCCIASAGVVSDNQVRLTNLGNLLISGTQIERDESNMIMKRIIKCVVINDFVAQGYGCLTLQPSEVKHLYGPKNFQTARGPKVCVGAGTGLGECFLTQSQHMSITGHQEDPYSCFPSEGGHVEFSPRNSLEVELYQYLSQKFCTKHRISVERVVSGKGLANVYEFLAYKFPSSINPQVHEEFLSAGDEQGRVVAQNATKKHSKHGVCILCQQAMSIMMSAYGCEVGSAAIKWIPTGGLFVSGGLTPKNMEFIEGLKSDFMTSYRNKGRVSNVLDRVPLYAVMTEDLGVRGAHKAALVAYQDYCNEKVSEKLVQNFVGACNHEEADAKKESTTKTSARKNETTKLACVAVSSAIVAAATSMWLTLMFHDRTCRNFNSTIR